MSDAVDLRRAVRAWALDARLSRERPRRPVLVGESPADGREDWPALFGGPSCSRLASFAGREWTWVVTEFDRRNVRGLREGGARRWDLRGRVVVALGETARHALGGMPRGWFRWSSHRSSASGLSDERVGVDLQAACLVESPSDREDAEDEDVLAVAARLREGCAVSVAIPHPSGLNRLYNDVGARARAGEVLRLAVRLASANCHAARHSVLPYPAEVRS